MMMSRSIVAAAVLGASLATAPPAVAQDVQLTFNDGQVTLRATNAAIGRVLATWTQVGGTTVINGDRVPGPPVTLELVGVPESQALDILLRGASGYMVAEGGSRGAAMSRFDRIYIVPVSVAPGPARAVQATPAAGSRARVASPIEEPEPADSDQVSAEAIGAPAAPAEAARAGRPAAGATPSTPPPAFGTWRDPAEAARQAAAATFGAATASRPGQATAVIPPPRPPGAPPTPLVENQLFDTRRGSQQLEPYLQQLEQLRQQQQQQQQQTAPPQ